MQKSLPLLDADALLHELNQTRDWPKMALLMSRAIGRIRNDERERLTMIARIADLERRLAMARQAGAA
jgi:hypothetical protein